MLLRMEEHARKSINMLQKLQTARYLTLNADTIEYFSSILDVLSQHSSPFSNLICLTIDYSMRENTYKVTMPNQVMKFLLDNSPTATFIMKLPDFFNVMEDYNLKVNSHISYFKSETS
ncbi:hypothetical protein LXL04_025898 [Taraxacum kok-saghyz]